MPKKRPTQPCLNLRTLTVSLGKMSNTEYIQDKMIEISCTCSTAKNICLGQQCVYIFCGGPSAGSNYKCIGQLIPFYKILANNNEIQRWLKDRSTLCFLLQGVIHQWLHSNVCTVYSYPLHAPLQPASSYHTNRAKKNINILSGLNLLPCSTYIFCMKMRKESISQRLHKFVFFRYFISVNPSSYA